MPRPSLTWTPPQAVTSGEGYLDWHRIVSQRLDALPPQRRYAGPAYEPIFVNLRKDDSVEPEEMRAALRDALASGGALLIDPHEHAHLSGRIDDPDLLERLPDHYMLYRRVGTPDSDYAHLFEVLDCGVPVRLAASPTASPLPAHGTEARPHPDGTPIVAIIDDGIGFLNRRFRRSDHHTRFHAVWLQALESRSDEGGILAGQVLSHTEIDQLLQQPEPRLYAQTGHQPRRAHGTHVLDLAAGAEPSSADPVKDWPLLAVQLPSAVVDDTSGTWMESYALQGLRWILRQASGIDPAAPLIVNLSLGVSAGPKDGSRFFERQMAQEAAQWERVTGQPVRLVWSFGNGHRSDLIAHWPLTKQAPTEAQVALRLQPDDKTASYVEIHLRDMPSDQLSLSIRAPDGTTLAPVSLPQGQACTLTDQTGAAIARLYHLPKRDGAEAEAAHYLLALAPTSARKAHEPVAPAGAWHLHATAPKGHGRLLMMVQRDDALPGTSRPGRQAYFDHSSAYAWDDDSASYTRPDATGPITRAGSHNALATAPFRQVITVGAAMVSARLPGKAACNFIPAPYSAAGAAWSATGPTVSAVVEPGRSLTGLSASGLYSGTRQRMSGTSAAAGRVSRALALSADRISANAPDPDSTALDDFDPEAVDLFAVREDHQPQLGAYVVIPMAARAKTATAA